MCKLKIRKTLGIMIILTFFIVIPFTGCLSGETGNSNANNRQHGDATSLSGIESNENPSAQNTDALNGNDISSWDNIDIYSERLGVTIEELQTLSKKEIDNPSGDLGPISLEYYGDHNQCVYEWDKGCGTLYFFNKAVFEKGSYCTAIAFICYNVIHDGTKDRITKSDLESYFGKEYKYYKTDKGSPGRYVYSYKDKKVVFFENSDSTISRSDYSVLMESDNQKVNLNEVLETLNLEIKDIAITESNLNKYEAINKYFNLIHKSVDEISKEEGTLNFLKASDLDSEKRKLMVDERENEPSEFYVDSNGIYYEFSEGDRTSCQCIWLPFKLAFKTFEEKDYITMEEFANHIDDANFAWMSNETLGYSLKFENRHSVFIPTYYNSGNPFDINTNQYIFIH